MSETNYSQVVEGSERPFLTGTGNAAADAAFVALAKYLLAYGADIAIGNPNASHPAMRRQWDEACALIRAYGDARCAASIVTAADAALTGAAHREADR